MLLKKIFIRACTYILSISFHLSSLGVAALENSLSELNKELKNLEINLTSAHRTESDPKQFSIKRNDKNTPQSVHKQSKEAPPSYQSPTEASEREALVYTNEYRKQKGEPPLTWSPEIANLCREHSEHMAFRRVQFGHGGFNERVARFPLRYMGTAENVFMMSSQKNIARSAVDAWIKSPGHEANLVGNYNLCGIGMYQSPEKLWYVTQMFALTR